MDFSGNSWLKALHRNSLFVEKRQKSVNWVGNSYCYGTLSSLHSTSIAFQLHKCSKSSETRNPSTDLVNFLRVTKKFTKSGDYCSNKCVLFFFIDNFVDIIDFWRRGLLCIATIFCSVDFGIWTLSWHDQSSVGNTEQKY